MAEYTIAKYIRLSLDDNVTDSMSIENQRLILDKHIADMDIPNARILEMVDNGYSGTNYERPAVQELLAMVREGKIDCICVKDFSRFGRNAIETGYFIEQVFPLFRTRFISVSDYFDSDKHEGGTGGMEVAFKFIMHEYYSKDQSRKIKSAKHEKMRRGEFVTKNCVFGYRLNSKRQYEIDKPAAKIVRYIFQMYADGVSIANIQRRLYDEKIPTASEYKKLANGAISPESLTYIWDKPRLIAFLADEQYIGTYVAGKKTSGQVGSKKRVSVPESEWVKIPDHHPAIIDRALFEAVQDRKANKPKPAKKPKIGTTERYAGFDNSPLKGKVICGCCGHALRVSHTKIAAFHCNYTLSAIDAECHRLRVGAAELEKAVFEMMNEQARSILSNELFGEAEKLNDCEQRQSTLQDENQRLYEQFALGNINVAEYKTAKVRLGRDIERQNRIAVRQTEREYYGTLREIAQTVATSKSLTRALVDLLIDRVRVFPGGKIEVKWKLSGFGDVLEVVENI
jgi:DNA invertase Pin-like site-specific DNA recombinase